MAANKAVKTVADSFERTPGGMTFEAKNSGQEEQLSLSIYARSFGDLKGKELSASLPEGIYRLYQRTVLIATYKGGSLVENQPFVAPAQVEPNELAA